LKIAIIGTAGRGESINFLNKEKYLSLLKTLDECITYEMETRINEDSFTLVSGGAAWMDHLAIDLFMMYNDIYSYFPNKIHNINKPVKLILHLPEKFNFDTCIFEETKTGKIANYYHYIFSKIMGNSSFHDLSHVLTEDNCTYTTSNNFFVRNKLIANELEKDDMVFALTIGKNEPIDGGTKHTWDLISDEIIDKVHISII